MDKKTRTTTLSSNNVSGNHNNSNVNNDSHGYNSAIVLWSTQSGRSKACARRCIRMMRSRGIPILSSSPSSSASSLPSSPSSLSSSSSFYGGSTFDDFGADNLLNICSSKIMDEKMSSSSSSTLFPPLLVLFVSTTGDGEHCDSIKECWNVLLQKSIPNTQFSGVQFALFCLGDRAYGPSAYCAGGRKLASRLMQLGASAFCTIGYGDDGTPNGGVFQDLDNWLEKHFLPLAMKRVIPSLPHNFVVDDAPKLLPPSYEVTVISSSVSESESWHHGDEMSKKINNISNDEEEERYLNDFFRTLAPATAYDHHHHDVQIQKEEASMTKIKKNLMHPVAGKIISNERITAIDWEQDVRNIRIEIDNTDNTSSFSPSKVKPYEAGDVAVIMPQNSPSSVTRFLSVLPTNIQSLADTRIEIQPLHPDATQWPKVCTLRTLFTKCADINGTPEREILRSLSTFVNVNNHEDGKEHADKLIQLSESNGSALYADYILREKRSLIDVFHDFDSLRSVVIVDDNNNNMDDVNNGGEAPTSALLTIEHLLGLLSPIMPRHFSIASSPSEECAVSSSKSSSSTALSSSSSFGVELCVAIVQGTTPLGRTYTGVCSGYLGRLLLSNTTTTSSSNDDEKDEYDTHSNYCNKEKQLMINNPSVKLWIRPGSFGKLPISPLSKKMMPPTTTSSSSPQEQRQQQQQQQRHCHRRFFDIPIMCVGAGTGIAPLRSILRERFYLATTSASTLSANNDMVDDDDNDNVDNILVFGCRKHNCDFHYKIEWEGMIKEGGGDDAMSSFRLLTAFSRDFKYKVYVQSVLKSATYNNNNTHADEDKGNGQLIIQHLLYNQGAIYIAGNANMARNVRDEIIEILSKHLKGGEKDAKLILKRLIRKGYFAVEAWT